MSEYLKRKRFPISKNHGAPSSSTKITEIKLSERGMLNIKSKAIKQFMKVVNEKNDKITKIQNLDINKEWLRFLYRGGADIESELIKKTSRRKIYRYDKY